MMMNYKLTEMKLKAQGKWQQLKEKCMEAKHPGIDGILVTVGLCIIALVLCVIMKDQLEDFIEAIVSNMTGKAKEMLQYTPSGT